MATAKHWKTCGRACVHASQHGSRKNNARMHRHTHTQQSVYRPTQEGSVKPPFNHRALTPQQCIVMAALQPDR